MNKLFSRVILFSLLLPPSAIAATHECTTGTCATHTAVNTIITGASSGDTITFAAGTYTLTGTITIPEGKTIILQGAGSGEDGTIFEYGASVIPISSKAAGTRITAIRFTPTSTSSAPIDMRNTGWRIDHCYFNNQTGSGVDIIQPTGADMSMTPAGVIDNNTIYNGRIPIYGGACTVGRGSAIWSEDSPLGTDDAVYIEDNVITRLGGNFIDSGCAGKWVTRYNTTTGVGNAMTHSIQAPNIRASRSFEMYGNLMDLYNVDAGVTSVAFLRAGEGVVFLNSVDFYGSAYYATNGNIAFDNVRSFAAGAVRNSYSSPISVDDSGLCNGSSPWDGNEAINVASIYGSTGSGTATSNDSGTQLTDSSKSWTSSSMYVIYGGSTPTGVHAGADSGTVLTKSTGTAWGTGNLVGLLLRNTTDGSYCIITDNTGTTATCTLANGSDNTWQDGDGFEVGNPITIYNMTTGANGYVYANTGTTVTHTKLSSGSWSIGDTYKITDGYPCRDQIGRGKDTGTDSSVIGKASSSSPVYLWFNYNEDTTNPIPVSISNGTSRHIQANRDYYSYVASFDGTVGTGCGTLASRPATCTTGVGYWATDQSCSDLTGLVGVDPATPIAGTLYKCTSTNTWTAYYTPYSYPHPLRGETTSYTQTPNSGTGFSFSPSDAQTVNSGSATIFSLACSYGYKCSVSGCGGTPATQSGVGTISYTTAAASENCAVTGVAAKTQMEGIGTGSGSLTIGGTGTMTLGN